jgi:acyl-CoA synthetase (NDP forming)
VIRIVGEDPKFDSLILSADVHNMYQAASIMDAVDVLAEFWKIMAKAAKNVAEKENKPVLVVVPEVAYPEPRMEAWNAFVESGLPVFRNVKEAVSALARVCDYYEIQDRRTSST